MLEEMLGPGINSEGRKCLQRIHASVEQMARITEDLLRLSRLGRQPLNIRPTNLDEILRPIFAESKSAVPGRRIQWEIGSLPEINCDQGLIKQVFANLISNAVKYTRLRENAIIQVGQTTIDDETVIYVRDNGAGFDMKNAQNLFGAFQRLHRQDQFEGTGVGLATVRRIIKRHGGRIWAEAEVEKGATFYLTLGSGKPSLMEASVR